jgi:hypothetical protein
MKNNEIHRQPPVFVSVLASLLLPASGHCNDSENHCSPCSIAKAEGAAVADDDQTFVSSSYISQSASIAIDDERSQLLRPAGMFGGKAPLRLAAQKRRRNAPPVLMRSAPAYFLCKW